jgi:hypothetical protein
VFVPLNVVAVPLLLFTKMPPVPVMFPEYVIAMAAFVKLATAPLLIAMLRAIVPAVVLVNTEDPSTVRVFVAAPNGPGPATAL